MNRRKPLIVGEVLFDHFPDGQRVLGGAPFNVAWNLRGFGLSPVLVSAVGGDSEGREVRQRMRAWGLEMSGLQSAAVATGSVQVSLRDGQPSYEIAEDRAYDHIELPRLRGYPDDYALLYVGSLALRASTTRGTVESLISGGIPRFVDVNIRQPWFDRACLSHLLRGARWVKLNDEELAWLVGRPCRAADDIRDAVAALRAQYGGDDYFVTCGAAGAYAVRSCGALLFTDAPSPEPLVDPIGAGDAFAAATIGGLLGERPLEKTLREAAAFAARTCTLRGATTQARAHYTVAVADDATEEP